MATGNYGIIRSADVSSDDIEVFYTYSPDRATKTTEVLKLDASQVIEKLDDPDNAGLILGGLYNLVLPTATFNQIGIYNIFIRPKRIRTTITDCGVLASKPSIRGVIFNLQEIDSTDVSRFENNGLTGYRIEYIEPSANVEEKKIQNLFRIITSNNKVEPISENLTNTTQKGIRYRLNDNSSLVFCTVTPSSAPTVKPNVSPFIGIPAQEVLLIPTFFDPLHVEVELTEHDFNTLAIGLYGNQTKSVADGIRTYYNDEGEIYKQFDEYSVKEDTEATKLYDVKEERDNIDFTKDFDNISNL